MVGTCEKVRVRYANLFPVLSYKAFHEPGIGAREEAIFLEFFRLGVGRKGCHEQQTNSFFVVPCDMPLFWANGRMDCCGNYGVGERMPEGG